MLKKKLRNKTSDDITLNDNISEDETHNFDASADNTLNDEAQGDKALNDEAADNNADVDNAADIDTANDKAPVDNSKKKIPLRISASLWKELVAWAADDFRSLNGQIEYLLAESVKQRRKRKSAKGYHRN